MKIIWSPLAVERTSEIAGYITIDNPSAAIEWVGKVFEKVDLLKLSPEMGREVPEISRKDKFSFAFPVLFLMDTIMPPKLLIWVQSY